MTDVEQASTKIPSPRLSRSDMRRRRDVIASFVEIYFVFGIAIFAVLYNVYNNPAGDNIVSLIVDWRVLWSVGLAFLELFSFSLNRRSILVGIVRSIERDLDRRRYARYVPASLPATPRIQDERETSTEGGGLDDKEQTDSETDGDDPDPVVRSLKGQIERSSALARNALRRPNALLLAGAFIAVSGLVFFILTLDSALFKIDEGTTLSAELVWEKAISVVPRLLMLLFIQVLAGFFLRQYRSSMEEVRYYESILRQREIRFDAYLILKSLKGNKDELLAFVRAEQTWPAAGVITKDQTTLASEAYKDERNEFRGMFESILETAKTVLGKPSSTAT